MGKWGNGEMGKWGNQGIDLKNENIKIYLKTLIDINGSRHPIVLL